MEDFILFVLVLPILLGLVYLLVRSRRRTKELGVRAAADIQAFETAVAQRSVDAIRADVALRLDEPLKPCRHPILGRFHGFGATFYGNGAHDAATGSFVATHWITAIYLPIVPLGRYRVVYAGGGTVIPLLATEERFFILGRLPLGAVDWLIAGMVWAIGLTLAAKELGLVWQGAA